ncbi:MAG: ferredoxin reductase [Hyphomicrobium sp.]|nr:ferredoxin reductase [Hyphomicrobium sp.]
MTTHNSRLVHVAQVQQVAREIKRFELVSLDETPLPAFSAGAHVTVTMRDRDHVWRNPYSLMGSPLDAKRYEISVLRVPQSRGGSAYMHRNVGIGSVLEISAPVNQFPLSNVGRKHIMIAGGIGITPFLAMLAQIKQDKRNFELHYAVRSVFDGAYFDVLRAADLPNVHLYRSDRGERIALPGILASQPLGTHLYVCGPQKMMDWALQTARREGWPDESVHCERFSAQPSGKTANVKLARSGKAIYVGEHQSILGTFSSDGVDAPSLCGDGQLLHNDHTLSVNEKLTGERATTCATRLDGGSLTLDL